MSPSDLLTLCRLCMVKDNVDVLVFEEGSKQVFLKIAACLPVSVAHDDRLPKKICRECMTKLNAFYEFWNQTLDSQKRLLELVSTETNDIEIKCDPFVYPVANDVNEATKVDSNYQTPREETAERENYADLDVMKEEMYEDCNDYEDGDDVDEEQSVDEPENKSTLLGVDFPEEEQCDNDSAIKQLQGYTDELATNSFGHLSKIFQVLNSPGEVLDMPDSPRYESPYRCERCLKSFSCDDILAMHRLSQCDGPEPEKAADDRKFQCEECGKTFLTKHHLRMHSSMHLDSKPFACQKCGTTFRYKKTYETHVKIHANERLPATDEQTFVCDVCEQRFSTRNSYIHHARSHKTTNKCKLMCFVCNRTFGTKRMLAQHLRQQCGETTHSCDICGKELLTKESLECHRLIHVNEKALVCQTCGKHFSHRKYFVVHQRIHTGERPYKCVTCSKTFTQASTLTVHRRYHTGERPYKCFVCSKGFVTRTIMLSHLKYHKEANDEASASAADENAQAI